MAWEPIVSEIVGRFEAASNATLLGRTTDGDPVVYKPSAGERPLWDFPADTLAAREVLAYEVSEAMGYGIVPEAVLGDGPYGPGSVQRFVAEDDEFDPMALVRKAAPELWPVAVFDIVTNNADRKLGHLISSGGRILAIDHGLTFHPEDKLRTVLWAFASRPLPPGDVEAVAALAAALGAGLGTRVADLLGPAERTALGGRVDALLDDPVHPLPPVDRPQVPWPLY